MQKRKRKEKKKKEKEKEKKGGEKRTETEITARAKRDMSERRRRTTRNICPLTGFLWMYSSSHTLCAACATSCRPSFRAAFNGSGWKGSVLDMACMVCVPGPPLSPTRLRSTVLDSTCHVVARGCRSLRLFTLCDS